MLCRGISPVVQTDMPTTCKQQEAACAQRMCFNAAHLELVTAVGDLPPEALFPPFCLSAMCLCSFEGARDCS